MLPVNGTYFTDTFEWIQASGWNPPVPMWGSQLYIRQYGWGKIVEYYPEFGPATTKKGYDPPITVYGMNNAMEDFAECFACYMMNRNYLSTVFPVKYAALETYLNSIEDFRRLS